MENLEKCPICKSQVYLFMQKGGIKIYKCSQCGFGFTQNTKLQTGSYHRDEEYIQEEGLFKNIFQKRVDIISQLTIPGRVLEVGCSTGLLLSLLKDKGWEVRGVEMSKRSADKAISRGIKVVVGSFENAKFENSFDLIIFNHVLEHVKDFRKVLSKTHRLLRPGGLILISLPNFDSFSAKIEKKNWPLLLPEEHLWHFTPKSLGIVLKEVGFNVIYDERISGIWDYGNPLLGILISLFSFKKRFFEELIFAIPTFLLTKMGIGSGIILVAKKK